jgi:hypothetical protein
MEIIMIILRLFTMLTLISLTGVAAAGVVKVDLKTGFVSPGDTIVINLNDLLPAHTYVLSCVLTSDHASNKSYDVIQITTPTNTTTVGVTADEVTPGSHRYNMATNKNAYIYGNITKDIGDISVTNLDDHDTIQLSSCHAVGRI